MNIKTGIFWLALISTLATWCQKNINPPNSDEKVITQEIREETKIQIEEILSGNKNQESPEIIISQGIAKIDIASIKWTPLDMSWIYEKNDLQQFFWINQYEVIFEKYNKDIAKKDIYWDFITDKNEYLNLELSFPRVHDSLISFFPKTINWFIEKYKEFKKDIGALQTVIIVKKLENWKFALCSYKEWELFLATHVSPWKISSAKNKSKKDKETGKIHNIIIPGWSNTLEWVFRINKSKWFKFKRSNKFESSPMPYSIQITWWFFLHHGANADWKKRSHWCVRLPWFYMKELYDNIENGIIIIIRWTE